MRICTFINITDYTVVYASALLNKKAILVCSWNYLIEPRRSLRLSEAKYWVDFYQQGFHLRKVSLAAQLFIFTTFVGRARATEYKRSVLVVEVSP